MERPGTQENPLRVAVIGSGPAGFYTVQALFQLPDVEVSVDMFERLPTPFGLVRHGVAPDHPKIKSVTAVYDKLARDPRFRFFGNVEYGKDLTLEELARHYHQVVFCTGAQTDRRLGIPGEELEGSHPATEFVAWYNGHPDFVDRQFDLTAERALVIGVGNVAVDVARILCRTSDELQRTDIADYALEALAQSHIREVWLVGRRGPAQAAFTNPEIKELGEMAGCGTSTRADEMELDSLSREWLARAEDKKLRRKLDLLRELTERREPDKAKRLCVRFLTSPVELLGDDDGRVCAVRLERNKLVAEDERLRSVGTGKFETVEAGLVFRSVGYHGVPLPGLPFDERHGVVPNDEGRVIDPESGGRPVAEALVSGWIKRGPSGVIGTNKPDAHGTVARMMRDREAGSLPQPADPRPEAVPALLERRNVDFVTYQDWCRLDALEIEAGREQDRPRVKFTRVEECLGALRA